MEQLGLFTTLESQGRGKVGVMQDVEELRPEPHAEASEIFLTEKFLYNEKSRLTSGGPGKKLPGKKL
jgi:hypothetical protein